MLEAAERYVEEEAEEVEEEVEEEMTSNVRKIFPPSPISGFKEVEHWNKSTKSITYGGLKVEQCSTSEPQ